MKKRIIIIGSGYGGLATASLLAKAGHDVTVVEKNNQLGGRAGQLHQDGFRFDTGPSWYLMPEVFDNYYSLFGINAQEELSLTRLMPGYKVFFESDKPITIQGDVTKDAQIFEQIEKGAGKKLHKYVNASTKLYNLSLRHFLYSNFTRKSQLMHKEILSGLPQFASSVAMSLDSYVKKQFNDSRIRRILEYHSVFLGGSPYEIPALYSLMSTLDFKSGVYFPKNGMYSLSESLIALGTSLGVAYIKNAPVKKIIVTSHEATGIELEDGTKLSADIVISNADLHHTETKLLQPEHSSYPESYWKKRQPGPSALLISLGIKGTLDNLQHHNLYFVENWKDNFDAIYKSGEVPEHASIYICNPSKTDPTAAPKGHENIFILVPIPANKKLSPSETSALTDKAIGILETVSGERNIRKRIVTRDMVTPQTFEERFNAWAYNALGGQSHLLSQSAFFRTPNISKKVKNLYYVGAGTTPGIGLPMCLISAQLVYKRIAGVHTSGPLETIEEVDS